MPRLAVSVYRHHGDIPASRSTGEQGDDLACTRYECPNRHGGAADQQRFCSSCATGLLQKHADDTSAGTGISKLAAVRRPHRIVPVIIKCEPTKRALLHVEGPHVTRALVIEVHRDPSPIRRHSGTVIAPPSIDEGMRSARPVHPHQLERLLWEVHERPGS